MNPAEHIQRVVARAKSFYTKTAGGHLLVNADFPVDRPSIPPLSDFDLDRQLTNWLDYHLAAKRPGWKAKAGLDDDSIPSIWPHFGIAEHSAWLGMEVELQEATCLPIPRIKVPEDLAKITLDESAKWFGYMKSGYDYLRSKKDGAFVLAVRGTMSPMDMANALRGDELYTDFLLDPEFCHRLMDLMVQATRWYYPQLYSWADEIAGGQVFFHGGWVPAKTIGHLSNDTALLCSQQIYEEFGFPYESRQVAGYDHILYHIHNEKLHYVPHLAELPRLALLEVSTDPKTVPPIENLPQIFTATGSANLMLRANSQQIREHIDELHSRNIFLHATCQNRADAEDIVRLIRDRSKPL